MTAMRQFVGEVLRARRMAAGLTLRDVSGKARVSPGYISEVERGQKEPSSELLAALTGALDLPLSELLRDVSDLLAIDEANVFAGGNALHPDRSRGTVVGISPPVVAVSAA